MSSFLRDDFMVKFCSECGFENKDTAKFCKSCGANLQAVNNTSIINSNNKNSKTRNVLIISIIVIIAIAAIGGYLFLSNQDHTLGNNTFAIPESAISENKSVVTENGEETASCITFNTSTAEIYLSQEYKIDEAIDLEKELGYNEVDSNIPFTIYDYCYSDREASEINDPSFSQYGFVGYFKLNGEYYTINSWSKTSREDALQPIMDFYQVNNQIEDI